MRLLRGPAVVLALAVLLLAAGCGAAKARAPGPAAPTSATSPAKQAGQGGRVAGPGDNVSVHYTGTLDDGKQFDSSRGKQPLTFTVGAGDVIAGFDRAVVGLHVGASVKVHIVAKAAYGERRDDLVVQVPAAQAPAGLKAGQRVSLGGRSVLVTAVTAETVTVDANHELAGQALNFEIELVSVNR